MIKTKCPNKYRCDFTCRVCVYDDIDNFRKLFNEINNENLAKNSFVRATLDFTPGML